ncbi:GD12098 [Drosophila simulans]|uniref:GD12098 n=1 Tax=Drosophila simulans TaxID=7240 RepID=B4QK85_DROSI|nr:GD12098 [Drosophila simulans]
MSLPSDLQVIQNARNRTASESESNDAYVAPLSILPCSSTHPTSIFTSVPIPMPIPITVPFSSSIIWGPQHLHLHLTGWYCYVERI